MVGETRLVVLLVEGPDAKYEVVGDWLCALVNDQLLDPVVDSEVHPVTAPSKDSVQMAPITVNALVRVDVSRLGLVAATFHAPDTAPVRLNWQRKIEPTATMEEAAMSVWPDFVSLKVVAVVMPVPETSRVTDVLAKPLAGVMPERTRGGLAFTIVPLMKYWPMLP